MSDVMPSPKPLPLPTYVHAYFHSTSELTTFLDVLTDSIVENESYDRDISRVGKLEDRIRLGRLLGEIRKCGDELKEQVDGLVVNSGEKDMRLRGRMRLLWVWKRKGLNGRMKRLDSLRMRFLVAYMGIVAAGGVMTEEKEKENALGIFGSPQRAPRRSLPATLEESIVRTPLRRITSNAIGHNEGTGGPQRAGWMGVVSELQNSPLMHKRRASIEQSSSSGSPRSPRTMI
ncbi:hypothetical protein ACMFMG_005828 [Clarireedia jacksonii]